MPGVGFESSSSPAGAPTEGSFAESPAGTRTAAAGGAPALVSPRASLPVATAAESSEKTLEKSSTLERAPSRAAEGSASPIDGAFSRAFEARDSCASACRPAATPFVYPADAALSTLRSMRSRTSASAASTTRRICSAEKEAPSSLRR